MALDHHVLRSIALPAAPPQHGGIWAVTSRADGSWEEEVAKIKQLMTLALFREGGHRGEHLHAGPDRGVRFLGEG